MDERRLLTAKEAAAYLRISLFTLRKIEQQGPPETPYDLPRTAFVARFLGQANMFDAEVIGSDGDYLITEANGRRRG